MKPWRLRNKFLNTKTEIETQKNKQRSYCVKKRKLNFLLYGQLAKLFVGWSLQ